MAGLNDIPEEFWLRFPQISRGLIGYPRSGTRWMRLLINDLYCQSLGTDAADLYENALRMELGGTAGLRKHPQRVFDIYSLIETDASEAIDSCVEESIVIRLHSLDFMGGGNTNFRSLVILRHPLPVVYSYLDYAVRGNFITDSPGEREDFARAKFRELDEFFQKVSEFARGDGAGLKLFLYRERAPFQVADLVAAMEHLRLPVNEVAAGRAVENFYQYLSELNSKPHFAVKRGGDFPPSTASLPDWLPAREFSAALQSFEYAAAKIG